jgi:hypothetical protein
VSDLRALDVGDPHPFVGGRIKVDVVDPDSELLDEAEVRPSVVLGEPLLAGKHPQCPVVELASRGGHGDTGTIAGQIGAR